MSKLIVEMEMPQACRWNEDGKTKRCPIAEWGGACAVTKLFEPFDDKRPTWCPIKSELVRCGECKHFKDGMCYNPNTYDDEKTCGNTVKR